MKKLIVITAAVMCSLCSFAEEKPGIVINRTDGSSTSIEISLLKSIKFSEGNMIVCMKDESQQTINLDDVTTITFADVITAIRVVTEGKTDEQVTITDISGRIIYKGNVAEVGNAGHLSGIYVITVGEKSHKVRIGK